MAESPELAHIFLRQPNIKSRGIALMRGQYLYHGTTRSSALYEMNEGLSVRAARAASEGIYLTTKWQGAIRWAKLKRGPYALLRILAEKLDSKTFNVNCNPLACPDFDRHYVGEIAPEIIEVTFIDERTGTMLGWNPLLEEGADEIGE
jgi:hypothetical protein